MLFMVVMCKTICVGWLICHAVMCVTWCCCSAVRASLRTTPRDSTGIPHILEHLSLCGSTKYPVRDPFFKMLTRSLATFMNAFTGELLLFPSCNTWLVPVYKIMADFLCILLHVICQKNKHWTEWPLTDDLDKQPWPRYSQDVPSQQHEPSKSRLSKVRALHTDRCNSKLHCVAFVGCIDVVTILLHTELF